MLRLRNLALLALFVSAALAQTDLTLEDFQKGEAVVDVVVERCWNLFGYDFKFMKRVALVESRFGEHPDTYATTKTGGIWKLREGWYNMTNPGNQAMANVKATIQSQFGVQWNTGTNFESLMKPLMSAFATRLWLMVVGEAIPNTIPLQASFWNRHMKSNETWTEADFIRIVNEFEETNIPIPCNAPMDICLVLDSSGSIGSSDFQNVRNFTGELIKGFNLDYVRTGVVYFGDDATRYINLNETMSAQELQDAVKAMPYLAQGTNTNAGIREAVNMFNETGRREGAPQVMAVMTDGQSNRGGNNGVGGVPDMPRVTELGIEPFSVGVGGYVGYMDELLEIAAGDPSRFYPLSNFVELRDFFATLTEKTCEAPQLPQVGDELNGTLVQNEKRFYKMDIPEEGVRVYYNIEKGDFNAYAARGELTNKPNEVVHEVKLTTDGNGFYFPHKAAGATRRVRGARAEENVIYIGLQGKEGANEFKLTSRNNVGAVHGSIVIVAVLAVLSKLF